VYLWDALHAPLHDRSSPNVAPGHVVVSVSPAEHPQAEDPGAGVDVVAGHTVHTAAADTTDSEPISQFAHALGPVAFLYWPGAHAEHAPPFTPVNPRSHVQLAGDTLEFAALEFLGHAVQFGLPSPENVLTGHGAHALAPASEYAPAGQLSHAPAALAPSEVRYAPARHATHALAPASEYAPAGQTMHALAPASEYCPAAQITHALEALAPRELEYVPARQVTHALAPLTFEYVPAGHVMHVPDELAPTVLEDLPTSQVMHSFAPAVLTYLPARQSTHTLAPVTIELLPAAQLIHTLAFVAPATPEYAPAGQFVHDALPLLFLYEPATQELQSPPSGPVYPTLHLQALCPELNIGELLFVGHTEHVFWK
jgi:hypothetical protein